MVDLLKGFNFIYIIIYLYVHKNKKKNNREENKAKEHNETRFIESIFSYPIVEIVRSHCSLELAVFEFVPHFSPDVEYIHDHVFFFLMVYQIDGMVNHKHFLECFLFIHASNDFQNLLNRSIIV